MATLIPHTDIQIDDRKGTVYRVVTLHYPATGGGDVLDLGEAPDDSFIIARPSGGTDPTLTTPAGTGNTDSKQVALAAGGTLGDYTMLVIHRGRNSAAL